MKKTHIISLTILTCIAAWTQIAHTACHRAQKHEPNKQRDPLRHVALIAINPEDSQPYALFVQELKTTNSELELLKGTQPLSATEVLRLRIDESYKAPNTLREILSSINEETGDILNIIHAPFTPAKALTEESYCHTPKNFYWCPVAFLLTLAERKLVINTKNLLSFSKECYAIIKSEWSALTKALQIIVESAALTDKVQTNFNATLTHDIIIVNNLDCPIDKIKLYNRYNILGEADKSLNPTLPTVINALDRGLPPYRLNINIGNNRFTYHLHCPIQWLDSIAVEHDVTSGKPFLALLIKPPAAASLKPTICAASYALSFAFATQTSAKPDMEIPLYNLNMDIKSITMQGNNGLSNTVHANRPEPTSPESTIPQQNLWLIPAYQHNTDHVLTIETEKIKYTWLVPFIAPGSELMLNKKMPFLASLKHYREGKFPHYCHIPLFRAEAKTNV